MGGADGLSLYRMHDGDRREEVGAFVNEMDMALGRAGWWAGVEAGDTRGFPRCQWCHMLGPSRSIHTGINSTAFCGNKSNTHLRNPLSLIFCVPQLTVGISGGSPFW